MDFAGGSAPPYRGDNRDTQLPWQGARRKGEWVEAHQGHRGPCGERVAVLTPCRQLVSQSGHDAHRLRRCLTWTG